MKSKLARVLLVMQSMAFAVPLRAEELKVQTPRGAFVHVTVDRPAPSYGKAPLLVIAPGQGYHKELPLIKALASKAAAAGIIVYRFDWSYFSADPKAGQPSDDLKNEVEDMQAVIDLVKRDASGDSSRIVLAGKSLGTLVSYQLFNSNKDYTGLILMTPLCTEPDSGAAIGETSYPGFTKNSRSISIIIGNSDPMCKLAALYDFARPTGGNISIDVFNGGHSLTVGAAGDTRFSRINDANMDLSQRPLELIASSGYI